MRPRKRPFAQLCFSRWLTGLFAISFLVFAGNAAFYPFSKTVHIWMYILSDSSFPLSRMWQHRSVLSFALEAVNF